jgi:hypothetical protein
MASVDSKLATLRRKAAKNDFEVEHLLEFAVVGNKKAVAVIQELRNKYDWPRSNHVDGCHVVPFGRWAEVVCIYLEGGCDALVEYARRDEQESFYFAVAILEELQSSGSVSAQATLADELARDLQNRREDAFRLAEAINNTLSFKDAPVVAPETMARLRSFLHRYLALDLTDVQRASVVCALRGVGNLESIKLINELPTFEDCWSGLEKVACKAIRKRLS